MYSTVHVRYRVQSKRGRAESQAERGDDAGLSVVPDRAHPTPGPNRVRDMQESGGHAEESTQVRGAGVYVVFET